jgi:type IV secretory pathway VirB2 component (pilin)
MNTTSTSQSQTSWSETLKTVCELAICTGGIATGMALVIEAAMALARILRR